MSKAIYVGVGDKARKVKNLYVGVDGKARKVKKGYIGVNGVARLFYDGNASGLVPAGYTELEYVICQYAGGSPLLSSGHNFSTDMRAVCDMQIDILPTTIVNDVETLTIVYSQTMSDAGSPQKWSGIGLRVVGGNKPTYTTAVYDNVEYYSIPWVSSGIIATYDRVIVDFNIRSSYLDIENTEEDDYSDLKNQRVQINTVSSFKDVGEIGLFQMHKQGYSSPKYRIYNFKLYKNGVLVQHLIPCINTRNVVGFFDVVSRKFLSSSNDYPFTAGPEA